MKRLSLIVFAAALTGLGCTPFATRDVIAPQQVEMKVPFAKALVTADETTDQNAAEKIRLLEKELEQEMRIEGETR